MQRAGAVFALWVLTLVIFPIEGVSQTWPDVGGGDSGLHWVVGSYAPMTALGSYGDYRITMDPWLVAGISVLGGSETNRFRTRFELLAVPSVAMRRAPIRKGSHPCEGCTGDSFRLNLVNARFLLDVTFPFANESRAYVTAGPAMRFQLSDAKECPVSDGGECALSQFGRSRIDPGLMAGLGWEPHESWIRAVQLTGRLSLYGRAERPEAAPNLWLPELELVVRF